MKKDEKNIMLAAINRYGIKAQVDIAIEEMSELTKALLKLRRQENDYYDYAKEQLLKRDVLEEMADVSIMLDQLSIIYGGYGVLRTEKLERLEMRMKYEE